MSVMAHYQFSIFVDWLILMLSITIDFYQVLKLSICNALISINRITSPGHLLVSFVASHTKQGSKQFWECYQSC